MRGTAQPLGAHPPLTPVRRNPSPPPAAPASPYAPRTWTHPAPAASPTRPSVRWLASPTGSALPPAPPIPPEEEGSSPRPRISARTLANGSLPPPFAPAAGRIAAYHANTFAAAASPLAPGSRIPRRNAASASRTSAGHGCRLSISSCAARPRAPHARASPPPKPFRTIAGALISPSVTRPPAVVHSSPCLLRFAAPRPSPAPSGPQRASWRILAPPGRGGESRGPEARAG